MQELLSILTIILYNVTGYVGDGSTAWLAADNASSNVPCAFVTSLTRRPPVSLNHRRVSALPAARDVVALSV